MTEQLPGGNPPQIPGQTEPKTSRAWITRLLLYVVPLLLLLLAAMLAAYYFIGAERIAAILSELTSSDQVPLQAEDDTLNLVEFDVFTAELISNPGESQIVSINLAIDAQTLVEATEIENLEPLIQDVVTQFLRGLRPDDFIGNAGLFLIREQLTIRITEIIKPLRIRAVLIREVNFSG